MKYKLIIDYSENKNYALVGRMNGVSAAVVKKAVAENNELYEALCERFSHEESGLRRLVREKHDEILKIIGNCLDILSDKEKLSAATVPQLTSCMGALMDNFCEEESMSSEVIVDDPLSKSLMELCSGLKSD